MAGSIHKYTLFSILLLCFLSWHQFSQERAFRFKRLGVENGLSQNSIFCITQGRRGFIWIGTEGGLNRYDGYTFKQYQSDIEDESTLSNSYILSILQDSRGTLWVGTDNGLNRYVSEKDRFIRYVNDPRDTFSLGNNRIFVLFEDSRGKIWIGTDGGLHRYLREKDRFEHLQVEGIEAEEQSHQSIRAITEGADGRIWIGTEGGGLDCFNPQSGKFFHYHNQEKDRDSLSNNNVYALHRDKEGNLWIGTRNGLNLLKSGEDRFVRFHHDVKNNDSLSDNHVICIHEDRNSSLWIGTQTGALDLLDRGKNRFIHFRNNPAERFSISSNRILSIFQDRSGLIWFGSYGGGLNVLNSRTSRFQLFQAHPGNPNSLSQNLLRPIYQDSRGILWVGTDGNGLNRIDRKKNQYTHYHYNPENPLSLPNERVFAILEDPQKQLWIGTNGGGFARFDPARNRFYSYRHDPENPGSLSNDNVRIMINDGKGGFWIGTDGGGLDHFDPLNESFIHYSHDPDQPGSLSNNRVFALFIDRKDTLWVGTFGGGLNRMKPGRSEFDHFRFTPGIRGSIKDDHIMAIYEDPDKMMWIGTTTGLFYFDPEKEIFSRFVNDEILIYSQVYSILEDRRGNLWMGTNKGLLRLNPKNRILKIFDDSDGLQSLEFNTNSAFKSINGEMFFGGINGFNAFYPGYIRENPYVPPIVLTRFQLLNRDVPIGDDGTGNVILEKCITETRSIRLSYLQNSLSFEFAALSFSAPEKNQYAYMMEGVEEQWNQVGNRRFAAYNRLPPGKYSFRVKGSNSDGTWNEKGIALQITIVPPFWLTYWFLAFLILFTIASIYLFYRYRVNLLQRRKKELEQIVDERTKQLEKANRKLQELATHDDLTGIANHRRFIEVLAKEWRRCQRGENKLSVILIDVDHFKRFNDNYGHLAGDECLISIASTLKEFSRRPGDLVARYGGEEFIMVLPETDSTGASSLAEAMRETIEDLNIPHEKSPGQKVTISLGVSTMIPTLGVPYQLLLSRADTALYQSKNKGRNLVTVSLEY